LSLSTRCRAELVQGTLGAVFVLWLLRLGVRRHPRLGIVGLRITEGVADGEGNHVRVPIIGVIGVRMDGGEDHHLQLVPLHRHIVDEEVTRANLNLGETTAGDLLRRLDPLRQGLEPVLVLHNCRLVRHVRTLSPLSSTLCHFFVTERSFCSMIPMPGMVFPDARSSLTAPTLSRFCKMAKPPLLAFFLT